MPFSSIFAGLAIQTGAGAPTRHSTHSESFPTIGANVLSVLLQYMLSVLFPNPRATILLLIPLYCPELTRAWSSDYGTFFKTRRALRFYGKSVSQKLEITVPPHQRCLHGALGPAAARRIFWV